LIGGLDLNEQAILANWYNLLISKGSLNWNVVNNLCGQTGVTCDTSNPKRVIQLYSFFLYFTLIFFFLILFLPFFSMKKFFINKILAFLL